MSLGEYLRLNDYGRAFIEDHLIPMGAAIWSTPDARMMDYPITSFVRFCTNHGLLQFKDRPQWYSVKGGSIRYLEKLTESYKHKIALNAQVERIRNLKDEVVIEDRTGAVHHFDHVVLACHADQALGLLDNPTMTEKRLLGSFQYQANKAILHSDSDLMPKNKKAWSCWNYIRGREVRGDAPVCLTYWMNRLQNLSGDDQYFVTLNPDKMPKNGSIIRSFLYHHPLFDRDAVAAQRLLWNLQGQRRLWFCGSYFGHGFHEDALQSALVVAKF